MVGRERGPADRLREILDDGVDVRAADRQVHHLAVGLDQGHAVQRLARGLGQAVSEIVGVDPPGRRPGLGEREAAPLRRPAVPVRLVVGPVHEVVDVFPERRHPARLDIEDVVPVVAFPVVRRPGVPVAGAPLDQDDLHRLPGELEQADSGRGAAQPGPDDDDPARTTELVRHVTTSLIQRGGARWAPSPRSYRESITGDMPKPQRPQDQDQDQDHYAERPVALPPSDLNAGRCPGTSGLPRGAQNQIAPSAITGGIFAGPQVG